MNSANKLAVIGGTFDPVHYGHLIAAEHARVDWALTKWFYSFRQASTKLTKVTDWEHRCRM